MYLIFFRSLFLSEANRFQSCLIVSLEICSHFFSSTFKTQTHCCRCINCFAWHNALFFFLYTSLRYLSKIEKGVTLARKHTIFFFLHVFYYKTHATCHLLILLFTENKRKNKESLKKFNARLECCLPR